MIDTDAIRARCEAASQKRWFKSKLIECSCGFGDVFLKITYEDHDGTLYLNDDEQPCWWIEIISTSDDFWHRLKLAWWLLTRRHKCSTGLYIDSVDLKELRDMANSHLEQLEAQLEGDVAGE